MDIEKLIYSESKKLSDFYCSYYIKEKYKNWEELYEEDINKIKNKIFFHYKKYWLQAAKMFSIREDYNAEKLIDAALMGGFKYPPQIPIEYTWKLYKQYLPALKEKKSEEVETIEEIVNSILEIKRTGTVKDWLNSKINQTKIINNFISVSPIVLSFSKAFIDFCDENCPDVYNFTYFRNKVFKLKSKDKVLEKIKNFLGEEDYC